MMRTWLAVRRFLRSPRVIVGEMAAIGLAGVLGAVIPQGGSELGGLAQRTPAVTILVSALALDRVFHSAWFAALALLAAASLMATLADQVRQARALASRGPDEGRFRGAPFQAEFHRPARLPAPAPAVPAVDVCTSGRLGAAAPPVFHAGLLLVILAGGLRAMFAADAAVNLIEGETLPPTAAAWSSQRRGVLAEPFRVGCPVTLEAVTASRYPDGALRELVVRLSLDRERGRRQAEVPVNHRLPVPGGCLFLDSAFGSAALIEWRREGEPSGREAVLLTDRGKGVCEGTSRGPGGLVAHLRSVTRAAGPHPSHVEVRVMRGRVLQLNGSLRAGEAAALPGGFALALRGIPLWARLHGSRDRALWLAWVGFGLVLAGAALMVTAVRVDSCVTVTPQGEREHVVVALTAQRFAPLFRERFERLVREQGGSP